TGSSNPAGYYNVVSLDALTCPNDINNFKKPSGLSYGGNIGYGDFPVAGGVQPSTATENSANSGSLDFHGAYDNSWVSASAFPSTLPADAEMARDTGVFWRDLRNIASATTPYNNDQFRMTLDRISLRDGLGQTLLILENHNARNW